jgi:hypothetical protein
MSVTATRRSLPHTSVMQRVVDEAEYVLAALHRMRDAVSADPTLFDPDAQQRIDEAIVRIQGLIRSTQLQLNGEQKVKAA